MATVVGSRRSGGSGRIRTQAKPPAPNLCGQRERKRGRRRRWPATVGGGRWCVGSTQTGTQLTPETQALALPVKCARQRWRQWWLQSMAGRIPVARLDLAVAVATGGRRRAPDEHAQTRTLAEFKLDPVSQISPIYGSLAWKWGGWSLIITYY